MDFETRPSNETDLGSEQALGSLLETMIQSVEPIMAGLNFVNLSLNLINIAVFLRMRLSDIMSLCLFFLSVSDFTSAFIGFISSFSACLNKSPAGPVLKRYIDLDHFWIYILTMTMISYNFANNVTSFVAIERCLYVAMPLKVKGLISMSRACVAIALFLVFAVVTNVPNFLTATMKIVFNPLYNTTRLELVYSRNRLEVLRYLQIIQLLVIGPISVVIVCVASYIMIRTLNRSSKLRSSMKISTAIKPVSAREPRNGASQNLSYSNIRLVKMLLILSISTAGIHVCTICFGIGAAVYPEFSSIGAMALEYTCLIYIFQLLYVFNQIINTFLYYHYNTKFKRECRKVLSTWLCLCGWCLTQEHS